MKRALIIVMVAILTMPALTLAVPRVFVTNYTRSVISVWLFGQSLQHYGSAHIVYPYPYSDYSLELPHVDVDHFFRSFPNVFVAIDQGNRLYPIPLPAQAAHLHISVYERGADGGLQFRLQQGG